MIRRRFYMHEYPIWLSKQMIAGVKSFNLDAYLVALEGWRRGLDLSWYYDASHLTELKEIGFNPIGKTFSLGSNEQQHFFYRSRGDKVTNDAVDIASNKDLTKTYLSKVDVPSPESKRFSETAKDEEIVASVATIGYPLVVKPTFGSLGKGVVTNIQTEEELRNRLKYVRTELNYPDILVERFIVGTDYRIYVAGEKVIAATKRLPANVIGDGTSTTGDLIDAKNIVRKENPYLSTKLIEVNEEMIEYLNKKGYTLQSIPPKSEVVFLKGQSNVAAGGDPIDATDDIPTTVQAVAINAVKAIPGMHHAGVDVIVEDNRAEVIEINATADICMHIFPLQGESRNVAEGIIDYYFPETLGKASGRTQIYFDYKKVKELMQGMLVQQIKIADAPLKKLYAKRYVMSGEVQKVGYRKWIQKQALKQNLHGYTKNLKNGKVVVVVGNEDERKVNKFKSVCSKGPSRSRIKDIQEYIWENQIKIGFEIKKNKKN